MCETQDEFNCKKSESESELSIVQLYVTMCGQINHVTVCDKFNVSNKNSEQVEVLIRFLKLMFYSKKC